MNPVQHIHDMNDLKGVNLNRRIKLEKKRQYYFTAAAAAKSPQSCPTLCDPMDCSPPGFSVHGILQARTLEWAAISVLLLTHKLSFVIFCFQIDLRLGWFTLLSRGGWMEIFLFR